MSDPIVVDLGSPGATVSDLGVAALIPGPAGAPGGYAHSANGHGASPDAGWETNRDAFQAANDEAAAAGGGVVTAKPGVYLVKGVVQDSRVVFDTPGVTLRSPDGLAPDVVASRLTDLQAIIPAGAPDTVYTTNTSGVEVGALVGIDAVGGILDTQVTTLTADITDSQTGSITLAATSGFPQAGTLRIGDELITYGSRSSGLLGGVIRGAYGTMAAAHLSTEPIGLARRHYAAVTGIVSATKLTIDAPVDLAADGVQLTYGTIAPGLRGVTIDGNAPPSQSASVAGVEWPLVRGGSVTGVTVINTAQGGFMLKRGASDCIISDLALIDCGIPDIGMGGALWMYQGCKRNIVSGLTVRGDTWVSIYLDDRTSTAEPWDAPNLYNKITGVNIDVTEQGAGFPAAINIVGSSYNYLGVGSIAGANTGFSVSHGNQGSTLEGQPPVCEGNELASLYLDVRIPWVMESPSNRLHDIDFSGRAVGQPQTAAGTFVYASRLGIGQSLGLGATFNDGTVGQPSIRFMDDPDTGIMRYTNDTLAVINGASIGAIFFPTQLRLADGMHLDVGQGAGSRIGFAPNRKLSFWGGTPVTQPAAVPDTTGADVAALEAEVNALKALLRTIGLMGGVTP